jgi:AcrR family transcriptional regulator
VSERSETRRRIIDAAAGLLREQGREAVTTRAVSAAAGVQPPTIYRLFTDMSGLLDAVAASGFDDYLERKHAQPLTDDPVEDLRRGWDLHVEFGLEHPAHYLLMYGRPESGPNEATERSEQRLRLLVGRIAEAGRLTLSVETAAAMVHAAGVGLILNLIGTAPENRDPDLPRRMREAVIGAVTGEATTGGRDRPARAAALRAVLDDEADLSPGERALLGELLDRLADAP